MTAVSLVLLSVLGQGHAASPLDLVPRLGAPRYADREKATTTLERLGRRALPALRSARELKDPEIRSRAAALVTRIEGAMLTQPTSISLQFQNAPLADVVKSVGEQSGVKLALVPESAPNWVSRRVTLHESGSLPFWKAIDRLCDAAHLQYHHGMNATQVGREPVFPLFEGGSRQTFPVSDSGPFRVSIVGLHYQRDVSFPPAPQTARNGPAPAQGAKPNAVFNEQFYAQIQVAGEPRLALSQSGALRISEALDDKGQHLVNPAAAASPISHRASGYFGFTTGSVIQLQAAMNRPARPGATIRRMKGVVPVLVSTRKPNPLIVDLASATGRTYHNDDVALTVHEIRTEANQRPPRIEVTIKASAGGNGEAPSGGMPPGEVDFVRPDSFQQQIEVSDDQGRAIPWYQTSFDGEAGRITLTLTTPDHAGPAARVRFFSLIRATTDVGFEFHDVPLP